LQQEGEQLGKASCQSKLFLGYLLAAAAAAGDMSRKKKNQKDKLQRRANLFAHTHRAPATMYT
jgi:hypothetical protein